MVSGTSVVVRRYRCRIWPFSGFAAVLCLVAGFALSQEKDGHFEVRRASAEVVEGVYYLNADIEYRLSQAAREALESGVPLTVELQIEVTRKRRLLPDPDVAALRQKYQLQYHALSERYIVKNLNSGEQESFPTIGSALDRLGRVEGLPILDEALLDDDKPYEIRLRAGLDLREFPGPLRLLVFWLDEWQLVSEWFTWQLRP